MDKLPSIFRVTSNRQVVALLLLITAIAVAAPVLSIATALAFVPTLPLQAFWGILSLAAIIPLLIAPPIALGALSILRLLTITIDRLDNCVCYDPLTGALSRVYLLNQIRERLASGGSFLMVDADHFKSINDTYGHNVGDEALKCLAKVLRDALPPEALVGRLGGEEFGAFLPAVGSDEAGRAAESLCEAMRQSGKVIAGHTINLTISIGVGRHRPENTLEQTMKLADEALYHAKRSGRDRHHISTAGDASEIGAADPIAHSPERRGRRVSMRLAQAHR